MNRLFANSRDGWYANGVDVGQGPVLDRKKTFFHEYCSLENKHGLQRNIIFDKISFSLFFDDMADERILLKIDGWKASTDGLMMG